MTKPIMVGVDGSPASLIAADYAAAMAERREAPLLLVQVVETLFTGYGLVGAAGSYAQAEQQLRESAEQALAQAVDEITTAHPGLKIDSRLEVGGASGRLIAASQEASMTVVGSHGTGGFAGLVLGSVSAQVAAHGHGPVIVVRPPAEPQGPVLVGFDGSEGAIAALQFGIEEALSRNATLVVANAYWEQSWGLHPAPVDDPVVTARARAEQLIAEALELPLEQYPDLRYEVCTLHSLNPEHSLVDESAHAALTVVGGRGRGGFAGLLLGSVSRSLVQHAVGPVAVIHPAEHEV